MENKSISLKEGIAINLKAFKIYYKKFPKVFISQGAYNIISGITPYVAIYISAQMLNAIVNKESSDIIWGWVYISLISTAIISFLRAIFLRWKNTYNKDIHYLTQDIYREKRMDMDFAITDSQKIRDLRSQINQTDNYAGWGFSMIRFSFFERIITSIVNIICSVALTYSLFTSKVTDMTYSFLNSPISVLIVIACVVLITAISAMCIVYAQKGLIGLDEDIKFANRLSLHFGRNILTEKYAKDIRIYNQKDICFHYLNKDTLFTKTGTIHKEMKGRRGIFLGIGNGVSNLLTGAVYVYVVLKALAGAFGIGLVVQYVAATVKFSSAFSDIYKTLLYTKENAQFLKNTFEFLEAENTMYRGSLTTEKRSDKKYDVEFKNVSFKYPNSDIFALKDVSVKFQIGKKLAIVGENGSGKTTFIKLLCRLYEPTGGEILLNGIDIKKYNYDDYIDIFAVVFQDFKLLSYSLAQNVATSTKYDKEKVLDSLEKAGFLEKLNSMPNGIETMLYKDIDKEGIIVSGGEAQKIAIARAIYKDAPFIILDEPTAALDPVAEAEIYSKFSEIIEDKTAVYISHRLSSCKFCDDILVFDKGSIIQTGNHNSLVLENGKYKELWYAQAQYYND